MSIYLWVLAGAVLMAALSGLLVTPAPTQRLAHSVVPGSRPVATRGVRLLSHIIRWSPLDPLIVGGLITFSALRFQVGTDYNMYWHFFQLADPSRDWMSQVAFFKQDIGYTWLVLITKSLTDNPFAIFWITSALTVIPIYAVIRRESKNLAFSVLLYICLAFYVAPFNGVRQGIAIALLFWAYTFIDRHISVYLVVCVAASLFHSSAIIAIALQLLVRWWKPSVKTTILVLGGAAVASTTLWSLPVTQEFLASVNSRFEGYVNSGVGSGTGTILNILFFSSLVILALAFRAHNDRPDWLAMLTISVVPMILGTQVVEATRMSYYFGIFAILLVPNILHNRKNSTAISMLVSLGAIVYFVAYLLNWGDLVPYQSYIGMTV